MARWEGSKGDSERCQGHTAASCEQRRHRQMFVICWYLYYENLNELLGTQLRQELRIWTSPPDPSTNHNIACGASHKQTAEWFFEGIKIKEWKSTSSLLWIHGKRTLVLPLTTRRILMVGYFRSGGRQEHTLVRWFKISLKS